MRLVMDGRGWCGAAFIGCSLAAACGLTTDPVERRDAETSRLATCENPSELPQFDTVASGDLGETGTLTGWCGQDQGGEVVYRFVPSTSTDVNLEFIGSQTTADATLRVQQGFCGNDPSGDVTLICDPTAIASTGSDVRHFFAQAGEEYFIIVDSDDPGSFAFDFGLRNPEIEQCNVHSEQIEQSSGATFRWTNEFARGHGRVDGACPSPGRENMFELDASYAGRVEVTAIGHNGLEPVLSVRQGCGGVTELGCSSPNDRERASLDVTLPSAGRYYVVIDSATIDSGDYELEVHFPD